MEYNQSAKDIVGDSWTIVELKELSTEKLWNWAKSEGIVYYGCAYLGLEKFADFDKEIWF